MAGSSHRYCYSCDRRESGYFDPPCGGWGPNSSYRWVDATTCAPLPPDAFQAGHDVDGGTLYVGRAFHKGEWLPAKVRVKDRVASVPSSGNEIAKHRYQVLCGKRLRWVRSSGGKIERGALEAGMTKAREALYVGRVNVRNSQTVGKVHPTQKTCFIPIDGKEMRFPNYEILVDF